MDVGLRPSIITIRQPRRHRSARYAHRIDRDEIFVPYDFDRSEWLGILDDELGTIFDRVPEGVRLYCILDTCHSGSATRMAPRRDEEDAAPARRFLPPPPEVMDQVAERGLRLRQVLKDDSMNRISISGCRDKESSWDYTTPDERDQGLMTYCLSQALEASGWQGSVSDIHQQVQEQAVRLSTRHYREVQTPQLHGPEALRNAPLFR